MTDKSPRLRNALKYMVYGREGKFDAERLIDLLQALEKFKAVRDEGDGSAFKVDGYRGGRFVGSAGDFRGSQAVDTSDRDTDIDGGRFRVNNGNTNNNGESQMNGLTNIGGSGALSQSQSQQTENDQETVREALTFFFSPEGEPFRDFLLEEIVTVVDASSREASQELARRLGLGNLPVPSFVRAMNPKLSDNDRRMVQEIGTLVEFLLGAGGGPGGDSSTLSSSGSGNTSARIRALLPIAREYSTELRTFGQLLVVRLTEKGISRGLKWATQRLNTVAAV